MKRLIKIYHICYYITRRHCKFPHNTDTDEDDPFDKLQILIDMMKTNHIKGFVYASVLAK